MYLRTGVKAFSGQEFEQVEPRLFRTGQEAEESIASSFRSQLRIYNRNAILPTMWKIGVQVGNFLVGRTVDDGASYVMSDGTVTLKYTIHRIEGNRVYAWYPGLDKGSMEPFWHSSDHPQVQQALEMAKLSGRALGIPVPRDLPARYELIERITPDDDPVTMLLILYAMQRVQGKSAMLAVNSDYGLNYAPGLTSAALLLRTKTGTVAVDIGEMPLLGEPAGFEPEEPFKGMPATDVVLCDAAELYELSPLYNGLPTSVEAIMTMLEGRIRNKDRFEALLGSALSSGDFEDDVKTAARFVEADDPESLLLRMVTKAHLIRKASQILDELPCSRPDEVDTR